MLYCQKQRSFLTYQFGFIFHIEPWVAGNEVIVKNVSANILESLSWLLLPFLALLCFAATAQFTASSLYWPNGLIQSKVRPRKAEEATMKTQVCLR